MTTFVIKLATAGKSAEIQVPITVFLRQPFVMMTLHVVHTFLNRPVPLSSNESQVMQGSCEE